MYIQPQTSGLVPRAPKHVDHYDIKLAVTNPETGMPLHGYSTGLWGVNVSLNDALV